MNAADIQKLFVREQLRPERSGGNNSYQLNDDSVSPTMLIASDSEDGLPIEETVCALGHHAKMVDPAGNVVDVALRTGRVRSDEPEAVSYERAVVNELIRAGWVFLDMCAHTEDFGWIRKGPLVKPAKGEEACEGKAGGCKHVHKVIAARRAKQLDRHNRNQAQVSSLTTQQAGDLMKSLGETFGQAVRDANSSQAGRSSLRKAEGEKDSTP